MASKRSEIRAERKALKEKEALQNASSGLKHKFTVVDALMYAFIAILSLICLYPFVNVIAYSLSGADAVLANDVTFYPKDFTLAAYKNIAARPTIWISLRVTSGVCFIATKFARKKSAFRTYFVYNVFFRWNYSNFLSGKKFRNVRYFGSTCYPKCDECF